ncbi:transposase [Flavobacterium sp. LB3P122]|uniref:transposase n=1 Tax=Flavobacterium algoriphilum TaxID=3398738 RepID=UPI003A8926F7
MESAQETRYVKRTQKDYTMSLKLEIVQEIERGQLTVTEATKKYGIQCRKTVVQWLIKFGNFDWENQIPSKMEKSPEQKIMELEVQIKLLEKQKAFLERQAFVADKKAILFDMMIDLAEKEYQIDIRKNSVPEQSIISKQKNNKK